MMAVREGTVREKTTKSSPRQKIRNVSWTISCASVTRLIYPTLVVAKPKTLSELRSALAFNELVSTFVRALHVGAVDISHSVSILANYQRFGPLFDQCCRFISDALREQGVYGGRGRMAADVAAEALEEVTNGTVEFDCVHRLTFRCSSQACQLLLDGDVKTDFHLIALSKILVNAFVIRGAQLSIINRLDGEHFISLHSRLVSWAAKKVAAYEANKKKSLRNKALRIFRASTNLLLGVHSEAAARM
jgi:cohesin complex subunit SA-1/2